VVQIFGNGGTEGIAIEEGCGTSGGAQAVPQLAPQRSFACAG
jgi:hypothetical protein